MKRWKPLTAALCAAVLLCGFSAVPAFAYADGGDWETALQTGLPQDLVERQNVVTAAHAPVRGVTAGGGTGVEAADSFLMGFDSAWQ